jgi:RHS repeat-associated protein
MESEPASGTYGIKMDDQLGARMMNFTPTLTAMMGLDYNSSSIGIDFGSTAAGVKKIRVIPDGSYTSHRVTDRTLDLYTSGDNSTYTIIPKSNWTFVKDTKGVITITLKESVATRYLKVHVKFDERDTSFTAKNKATFLNDLAKMLRVYQEATSQTEEFQYDAAGNRKYQRVTLIRSKNYDSAYYANSDRLKTDGKYAFVYDDAGNMVEKGNTYSINGDTVTFTAAGDNVEYWTYRYDLLNRLIQVTKNGSAVSSYEYSPDGLREVKRGSSGTIHYVFEGMEPIFEKRIADSRTRSYIYALGKHLARVDGVIGDTNAKVYYYHTDNVGSVKAVTDATGKVVYNADYFAYGTKYTSNGDFDETHGFTGKEYDSDTGLYYYNARWYDSELGRFISEDPVMDPNNPNLYCYCRNNPLRYLDPTGTISQEDAQATAAAHTTTPEAGSTTSFTSLSGATITGTWGQNGQLSSVTSSYTQTSTSSNATTTKTTNTHTEFDSNGNVASRVTDTEFTKAGDNKTVRVTTMTIGNLTTTWYTITDQEGQILSTNSVTDISMIGMRDWGTGKKTTPSGHLKGSDTYDDMLIVVNREGRIATLDTCNFESTNVSGYYENKTGRHDLTGKYNDMADGSYEFDYGYHGTYPAFWVKNGGDVPGFSYDGKNITMRGIHIHRGGDDWSWSTGCITVYDPTGNGQWSTLMSFFANNPAKTDSKGNPIVNKVTGNRVGEKDRQRAGSLVLF